MRIKKKEEELKKFPEGAAKILADMKVTFRCPTEENNFNKRHFLYYYDGFDFLENSLLVRPYIQQKYEIDLRFLEILLYLFPKSYFTNDDYAKLIRPYYLMKLKLLEEKGFVVVQFPGKLKNEHVYRLSNLSVMIVKEYYECLAGIKHVPESRKRKKSYSEKKRNELAKEIQNKPVPETRKVFFPKSDSDGTD